MITLPVSRPAPSLHPPFQVERVAATDMPLQLAYIALHNDYAEDFCPTTHLSEDRCGEIVVDRLLKGDRGHYGPLEHASLTLALRADHNSIMQLRTHRLGSFDVQSMRYTGARIEKVATHKLKVEDVFYVRPPGEYRDRQGDPYAWSELDVEEALAVAFNAALDYKRLRDKGVSEEQARGVLPTSFYQNAIVTFNARAWLHLLEMRLKADAQWEIRVLMEQVERQVQRWIPEVHAWWATHRRQKARLAP